MDLPVALSYDDVLLIPQYSRIHTRSQIDLSVVLTPHITLSLPLISSNMDTVTGVDMAIALGKLGGLSILPRFNRPSEQADMVARVKASKVLVGAAIGIRENPTDRTAALVKAGVNLLVIDVAHGHMQQVIDLVSTLKSTYPSLDLVCGNTATYEATKALFEAGADCVKVGIGPGSICTTRIQTGFGVPQITACMEAAKAAREFKKTLICDGGTKNSGDIVKGLAAGTHAVMLGRLLAGTDESPGEIIEIDGKQFKKYNGSTSSEEKHKQLNKLGSKLLGDTFIHHIEGVSGLVPYKGPVANIIKSFEAGIRSGYSYAGATDLAELHQNAHFMRITPQGMHESASHGVILT